jgi:hypothetical protein
MSGGIASYEQSRFLSFDPNRYGVRSVDVAKKNTGSGEKGAYFKPSASRIGA